MAGHCTDTGEENGYRLFRCPKTRGCRVRRVVVGDGHDDRLVVTLGRRLCTFNIQVTQHTELFELVELHMRDGTEMAVPQ